MTGAVARRRLRARATAVARAVYYELLGLLPVPARLHVQYRRFLRRPLHLRHPRTFSEKVNWRIVHDRRPLLAWTCDKLAMKEHAARTAPDVRIPRTLWSGADVMELLEVDLPERWVLKPNGGSRRVHFGSGRPTAAELRRATRGWGRNVNHRLMGEWAYGQARPLLLVEERIPSTGTVPQDYKFYVFDGVVRLIEVHSDRYGDYRYRHYLPDWTSPAPPDDPRWASLQPPPELLDSLLDAAGRLGAPFDFMRIDLYESGGAVWFGETTPYPGGGFDLHFPDDLDAEMGVAWDLGPAGYRPGTR